MKIEQRTTSEAPPDAVWAVLSDLDRWPEWLPTVDRVTREDPDRPHEVGAAYTVEQPKLPQAKWIITKWEPGKGFTWESTAPGVKTTGTHYLTANGSGTEIELSIEWTGPLGGLLGLLYGRIGRRYVATEGEALAERATQ